jgi:hypothetical protein
MEIGSEEGGNGAIGSDADVVALDRELLRGDVIGMGQRGVADEVSPRLPVGALAEGVSCPASSVAPALVDRL